MSKITKQEAADLVTAEDTRIELRDLSASMSYRFDSEDSTVQVTVESQWLTKAGIKSLRRVLKALEDRLP